MISKGDVFPVLILRLTTVMILQLLVNNVSFNFQNDLALFAASFSPFFLPHDAANGHLRQRKFAASVPYHQILVPETSSWVSMVGWKLANPWLSDVNEVDVYFLSIICQNIFRFIADYCLVTFAHKAIFAKCTSLLCPDSISQIAPLRVFHICKVTSVILGSGGGGGDTVVHATLWRCRNTKN